MNNRKEFWALMVIGALASCDKDPIMDDYNVIQQKEIIVDTPTASQPVVKTIEAPSVVLNFLTDPEYSQFRSDSVSLDTFIDKFIADALVRGYDVSDVKDVLSFEFFDETTSEFGDVAGAGNPCTKVVYLNDEFHTFNHVSPQVVTYLYVIYHEIGHAYFNYQHPLHNDNVVEGFGEERDIMGYSNWDDYEYNEWEEMLDRYFDGFDHTYLAPCN